MTQQKDKVDLARTQMLKTVRAAVRLRHSLAADAELNAALPEAERMFDAAIHSGELPDPLSILEALHE